MVLTHATKLHLQNMFSYLPGIDGEVARTPFSMYTFHVLNVDMYVPRLEAPNYVGRGKKPEAILAV